VQHKSLLLFSGKKVIVAKVKLCGTSGVKHNELASEYISYGQYTTPGGILQEVNVKKCVFSEKRNMVSYCFSKTDHQFREE